jgi:hypothetical protein
MNIAMHTLRFSVYVLILCGLLQSLTITAKPSQEPLRRDAQSKSTEPAKNTDAERVVLYDRLVSFVPPAGFSKLPDDVVADRYREVMQPTIIYGNDERAVSIWITFPPQRVLSPEQLPEFKTYMEPVLEKQKKDLKWLRKELVEINGRRWIHFEFLSAAQDATIHNHLYITSLDERALAFNFNVTTEDYEKYKDALEKSKDSIQTGKPGK